MSDPETTREALIRILYNKIDRGLEKRDAYEIVDAIEALILDTMADAVNQINVRLERLMSDKSDDV